MALEGAEEAVVAGAHLLERARAAGTPVVHIMNDGGAGTPYDIRADIGAISDEVAPANGEAVVVKQFPNAFHLTELEQTLTDLGYRPTVVADTTTTRALTTPDGTILPTADTLPD